MVADLGLLNMVGKSNEFCHMLNLIRKIATCDATVLIEGETGTGKELAARAIHYLSERREFPFLPVNCGAIPDNLVENELFGHAKGAFTDARDSHVGLVREAAGGTLFLDEIEVLSPKAQITLLRFLQDRHYRPLGSTRQLEANVRVIAATNVDLRQLIEQKIFREDLFFRLKIMWLSTPPLRKRHGDIELLAEHFGRHFSQQYGRPPKSLHADTRAVLNRYHWPGNIRELENVIHRAFLLTEGNCIRLPSPESLVDIDSNAPSETTEPFLAETDFNRAKAKAIAEFERTFLHQAMRAAHGNVSLAARSCGKERRTFGRLLKKHRIDSSHYYPTESS